MPRPIGKPGNNRKVEFTKSKNGDQILLIDQYRYYKENEDAMLIFWKCEEHTKSKCSAAVATVKRDRSRVVVLNDEHKHPRMRRTPIKKR